MAAAFSLK